MQRFLVISLFLVFFIKPSVYSQNWALVWSDEFNDETINPAIWTRQTGGHGWGNNELQYYTDRDDNAFLQEGMLIIKAMKENYQGNNYTSARLTSRNKKSFRYGKIEARIKLPYGQGIWPAFWMMGVNYGSVGWPKCGEIDIMEMIGGDNRENIVHGTVHWDHDGNYASYGKSFKLNSGTFAQDFHIFYIIWENNKIEWYVDDVRYNVIDITPDALSEFHQEFFIQLNLAVGGRWPGNPDGSTEFPQKLTIDYVRVYQHETDNHVQAGYHTPEKKVLFQNYPNPFNAQTVISFSLDRKTFATLKIFDVNGRLIASLLGADMSPGDHSMIFSSEHYGLPSGIYFAVLETERHTVARKLIFME
ncbi:family 16 glycosylhydrolase [candidate division KSB1 bacterium]|nr:family 16 glycosylhydrolase [candidate division KSB1 bacterium]